jgi:hypothetical protein
MATGVTCGRPSEGRDDHECPSDDDSLFSLRVLVIIVFAAAVGLMAGAAAGLTAGIKVGAAEGISVGVSVGVPTGFVAGMLTCLTVAKGLHALVSRNK